MIIDNIIPKQLFVAVFAIFLYYRVMQSLCILGGKTGDISETICAILTVSVVAAGSGLSNMFLLIFIDWLLIL